MKNKKQKTAKHPVKGVESKVVRNYKAGLTNCLGETINKKGIRDLSAFFFEDSLIDDVSDYFFSLNLKH